VAFIFCSLYKTQLEAAPLHILHGFLDVSLVKQFQFKLLSFAFLNGSRRTTEIPFITLNIF